MKHSVSNILTKMLTSQLRQDWMNTITNIRFPVSDLLTWCVSQLCVKNGNNRGTSVHQINFTMRNRPLVAVLVCHWAATTQSSSTVFELVIQNLQTRFVKLTILRLQLSTFWQTATFTVQHVKNILKWPHSRVSEMHYFDEKRTSWTATWVGLRNSLPLSGGSKETKPYTCQPYPKIMH